MQWTWDLTTALFTQTVLSNGSENHMYIFTDVLFTQNLKFLDAYSLNFFKNI